jgi:hypothetical protein
MTYAIVQQELIVPDVEQLKRAFSVSPDLTPLDAQTAANDAYGILLRGQEFEQAQALKESLELEQVKTVLVEEAKLPILPQAHVMRQVELSPGHLTIFDPMRRTTEVPWKELMFIAAGYVHVRERRKQRSTLEEAVTHPAGFSQDLLSGVSSREEESNRLLLDLYLQGGLSRFSMVAEEFLFAHLGSRMTDDVSMNFVLLVQELSQAAPHAGLNRGAFMACQNPPELFPYPSKSAFSEEMIWMLWRISQPAMSGPSE